MSLVCGPFTDNDSRQRTESTRISSSKGKVTLEAAVAIFGAIGLLPVLLYC